MNFKHTMIIAAFGCSLLFTNTNTAHSEEGIGLDVKAGTLGLGVELSAALLPNTRLRGGLNYLNYSFDSNINKVKYDFESDFQSISLLFDWHPFSGSFFLSGGAYFNNNTISANGSVVDGALPVANLGSLADLVSISGDIEFSPIAPYLGIGWRSNSGEKGWGLACDLGVMFQGSPDVTGLRVDGPIDVNHMPQVQDFLAEQEAEIEDDLKAFQYYPVASVILSYNF